jgi:diacylglycerol kinase
MTDFRSKSFFHSVGFALSGISFAFKTQRNLRIQVAGTIIVIILSFLLKINFTEWAIVFLCIAVVYASEMFNTAIESVIDLYCGDNSHELAKNAKDVAAGAVLSVAICVFFVGVVIFLPKLLNVMISFYL